MKYDGKIIIGWQAGSDEILTSGKGCDVDMINALAESTIAILNNASVLGLRGKDLRDVYIAYLINLSKKKRPIESTCIKIPVKDFPGGVQ